MDYAKVIRLAADLAKKDVDMYDGEYKDACACYWAQAVFLYCRVLAICVLNNMSTNGIPDVETCPRAFMRWVNANR